MRTLHLTCALLAATHSLSYAATIYVNNNSSSACSTTTSGCGSYFKPFRNLREAIDTAKPGDEVVVYGNSAHKPYYFYDQGTPQKYIGQSLMLLSKFNSTSRTIIRSAEPFSYKPIIRGTLVFKQTNWTLDSQNANGYLYKMPWSLTQYGSTSPQEPEQVFRDALPSAQRQLQQVGGTVFQGYYPGADASNIHPDLINGVNLSGNLWPGHKPFVSLASLSANQFYYDRIAKVLYMRLATPLTSGESIEVGATQFVAFGSGVNNVTLKNLIIERSNTSSYWRGGAVLMSGNGVIIDGVDMRDTDSHCLQIDGNNNVIQNSTFTRCGQVGLAANGSSVTIKNNYFTGNNFRNFNADWEAGPTKFIGNSGLNNSEISSNVITANNGHGIWLDTHNNGNVIRNNVVAFNRIGVFLEDSAAATIQQNVIFGNKAQGIQFRGSPNSVIDGNLIVGNAMDGIFMHPAAASEASYPSTNIRISNNVFAWHDEATNKKPVWVTPSTTLYGNRYCGSPAGDGSLHFWLQDWKPDPSLNYANNVFDWAAWRSSKPSPTNNTAPAYDNSSTSPSTMQLAMMPARVQKWQSTPEMGLTAYPNGITNTRSALQSIVNASCM